MFWDVLQTFVSVLGDLKTSSAQQKAATFNKNISIFNQQSALNQGTIDADKVRKDARRQIGLMRANIGASGFDLEGSGLDLLYQSSYEGEMDAQTAMYNARVKAKGYSLQGQLYGQEAKDAGDAGYINAASSILKGGAKIYENNTDYGAGTTPFSLGG